MTTSPLIATGNADAMRLGHLSARARKQNSVRNELSGIVTGSVIHAGTIGSVVLHEPSAPMAPNELATVADQLALAVTARWRREEERQPIQDPVPLPVRWRNAAPDVTDQ